MLENFFSKKTNIFTGEHHGMAISTDHDLSYGMHIVETRALGLLPKNE
jgi:hypothetical protein